MSFVANKHSTRKMSALRRHKSKSVDIEYTTKDLPSLRRKRTIAYKRLHKALEIGTLAVKDFSQRDLFFSYCDEVREISATFENAHFSILEILNDPEDEDSEIQERFDETYFRVLSISRHLTKGEPSQVTNYISSNSSNIRLPKISLPNFDGCSIKKFPEYFDTFTALIHNAPSLSDTEKFHYLVSSLSGDALAVVKTFPLSHEYYPQAYEALVARYKRKRDLAFTCWRDLLSIDFKSNNANEFRKSLDLLEENLSILKTADLPVLHWDFILVYHILSKLDTTLRRHFEEKYSDVELPTYNQLKGFLRTKCEALLRDAHFTECKSNKTIKNSSAVPPAKPFYSKSHALVVSSDDQPGESSVLVAAKNDLYDSNAPPIACPFCKAAHSISACTSFLNKTVEDRITIANDKNWCFNCLRPSHQLKNCNSIFSCRTCRRKHHTLLHRDKPIESANPISSLVSRSQSNTAVLLATAIVQVRDASGNMQCFRALFDTGSQSNFITTSAVNRLNLQLTPSSSSVSGLGEVATSIIGDVNCQIGTGGRIVLNLDLHVISKICGDQPIAKLNTAGWSHIKSLPLADIGFDVPGPIDLLFAADVFADSLLSQQIKGGPNQPTAFNSIFGWLLLGKSRLASSTLLHASDTDSELNSLVQQFWKLESLPASSLLTPDESLCENKFVSTHSRDHAGRYIVHLPFKEESEPTFEGSREVALRRFHAIERRLSRDPDLHRQYAEFMADYLAAGHMTRVPREGLGKGRFYIPHHCILRPESTTTRLRVVFDASAKDFHSNSLNDTQLIGPKLQPNILEIILRFREHQTVFIADVRQMYRQILVSPDHQDYQRIFWRASVNEPLQEYRLNTLTYGVSSSPFLACRTVRQLAEDEGDAYPIAKQILLSDVYIDDIVTGSSSLAEAQQAQAQVVALFGRGRFHLRKWMSNDSQLLTHLPPEDCLTDAVSLDNSESISLKVLGLKWDPTSDAFLFEVSPSERPCTKRSILSELARIFDPLGFLSPITVLAKCLIQKLWVLGVEWDQSPPEIIAHTWDTYRKRLPLLADLRIPRQLIIARAVSYELHGFCDSSESAYGAVIYLRVVDETKRVHVFLVCSRARVAPLKSTSLPRLELCAAVLLSDLFQFVRDTYLARIHFNSIFLWSDSTIVLAWLRSHSSRWSTFVANRVSHIQEITPPQCWHHVSSADNPADLCSRGQFPDEIVQTSLWWAGPWWLAEDQSSWPSPSLTSNTDDAIIQTESRKFSTLVSGQRIDPPSDESHIFDVLLTRFSSFSKIINIVSYMNRFLTNVRKPHNANYNSFLNNVERHEALMLIVKYVQSGSFAQVFSNLLAKKPLMKSFRKLNPFVDKRGILRVGGRISRAGLEYEHKHPALLPSDHPFTILIIEFIHRNYCHPGINTTQFLLLQQFWVISAKRVVRSTLAKCIKCFKTNPQPLQPFMSDLPSYRVNQVKAFSIVGVDFGGPFRIKLGPHRGAKIDKAYLCLFVCLVTKAVHLEVVSTLSTEGFIAALRRFVARRGRCNIIHADCGTNFVGARNQLSHLMQQASSSEKIEFKFNPPSAPHFGGVWEIQIKAAKSHLLRVVGDQVLTFEELTTLFAQIESVLNSRPLCPISSDPNDLSVLTPGHFLTLEPLTAVPDEDLTNINLRRLHRWQLLQAFHRNFWRRWKHEYLNSLTQRAKWTKDCKPLPIGSMVIIKDDNRAPLHWAVGRVVDLQAGADGVVRIAVVKTAKNHLLQRPLIKLCPLPIE